MIYLRSILLVASFTLLGLGCEEEPSVQRYQIPKSVAPAPVMAEPAATASEYGWTVPEGWEVMPAGGMRLASFSLVHCPNPIVLHHHVSYRFNVFVSPPRLKPILVPTFDFFILIIGH